MDTLSQVWTVTQLKQYAKDQGSYFFSPGAMRFFNSRVLPFILHAEQGIAFITSEQFDYKSPRFYTVRLMREDGNIDTVGDFQAYDTPGQAKKAAKALNQ